MKIETKSSNSEIDPAPRNDRITLEEARGRASLTIKEFASLFGCSTITIYRRVEAGKIPNIQIGSRRLIPNSYYMKLIEEGGKM